MKKFFINLKLLAQKTFTQNNISKVLVIFTIGITSRYLVNDYFDINVFVDYLNQISVVYYSMLATFIVFIHELFAFYNLNLIPKWVSNIFNSVFIKPYSTLNINRPSRSISSQSQTVCAEELNDFDFYQKIAEDNPYTNKAFMSGHPLEEESYFYNHQTRRYEYYGEMGQNETQDMSQNVNQNSEHYFLIDSINSNLTSTDTIDKQKNPFAPKPLNIEKVNNISDLTKSRNNLSRSSRVNTNMDINHINPAALGYDKPQNFENYPARNYHLGKTLGLTLDDIAQPPKFREVHLPSGGTRGKTTLGIKYYFNRKNIESLYVKYHDISKRKFYWNLWEKHESKYESYEDFKANFDPNMKIFREIAKTTRSNISKEIRDLLDTNPFSKKQTPITSKNISNRYYTVSQADLNRINSTKNKAVFRK